MDLYAVLGNPVEHSRSPDIHAQFARQTRQVIDYSRRRVPLDGFEPALRAFAAEPGARGCNVTVPFKFEAWRLATRHSARARLAGAVNTLRFDADGWYGDNTDGVGLVRDIESNAGRRLAGLRLLVLGAGGAAAGILGPLLEARPAELVLANRTAPRAQALVARHEALAHANGVALRAAPMASPGERFDLLVNATASSLQGEAPPVTGSSMRADALAVDLMYGPATQGFMHWAQTHGATPRDGLGMLVEQAAEAFALWRGVRPDTAPVLRALRAALQAPTC